MKRITAKKPKHARRKLALLVLFSALFVIFGYLLTYLIVEYKATHTWTFQAPLVIERNHELVQPIATTSALPVAYAQEIQNPFPEESPKGVAWEAVKEKWGINQWAFLEELYQYESGWNPYAVNQSSGAAGIPQALGHDSYDCEQWEYKCQIDWGLNYIENRYETPEKALEFWYENNWY